jgi:hypothetical protein
MPTQDVYNRGTFIEAMTYAARTTSANGVTIDLTAFNGGVDGITFAAHAVAITDGTHTFSLADSPDSSTWTAVAAPFVQAPASPVFNSSTTAGTVIKLGYLGIQRYVRLVSTVTGASTGGTYDALAIEWYGANLPAS